MENTEKSSSFEQAEAEKVIFDELEATLKITLKANHKIYLADNAFTYIQPAFYSEDAAIVGELKPVYDIYGHELLTAKDLSIDHFIPWSYVTHDELWNLHPTTRSINRSKSNKLPDWGVYFPRLSQLEYFSYEMMWKYDKVHKEFEKCAREHLNNDDVRRRIYRKGITYQEFAGELENVLHPVYQSAKNCGFGNWIYEARGSI